MKRLRLIAAVWCVPVAIIGGRCATAPPQVHEFYIDSRIAAAEHDTAERRLEAGETPATWQFTAKVSLDWQFDIVVDDVRLRDLEALKGFVARLRRGSTLRFIQGCIWWEGQPLATQAEIDDLRHHCEKHGVIFEIVGGG